MKKLILAAALLPLMAMGGMQAGAGTGDGFALSAGIGNARYKIKSTKENIQQSSYGGSVDYQFALASWFSVVAGLSEFGGEFDSTTLPDASFIKVDALELQARLWFGAWFLGAHYGSYVAATTTSDFSPTVSGSASGRGFLLGVEGGGGWFLVARTGSAKGLEFDQDAKIDVTGTTLQIGFRWK